MSKSTQSLLVWAAIIAAAFYAWRMYQARKSAAG